MGNSHNVMVIDTDRCVGCWTCAVACKEINNEPLGVWWNRILTTAPNQSTTAQEPASQSIDVPFGVFPDVSMAYLPVACQHCNDAPCVKVCPVQATFRRDDGVVLIDYDRCIGCRYCMAACPYGVRIFNWGEPEYAETGGVVGYGQDYSVGGRVVFTPQRPKGVVEKCTFCVELIDNGDEPFCVQCCPVGARVFGDLDDPTSEVSHMVQSGAQQLHPELGTDPNVYYMPAHRRVAS